MEGGDGRRKGRRRWEGVISREHHSTHLAGGGLDSLGVAARHLARRDHLGQPLDQPAHLVRGTARARARLVRGGAGAGAGVRAHLVWARARD